MKHVLIDKSPGEHDTRPWLGSVDRAESEEPRGGLARWWYNGVLCLSLYESPVRLVPVLARTNVQEVQSTKASGTLTGRGVTCVPRREKSMLLHGTTCSKWAAAGNVGGRRRGQFVPHAMSLHAVCTWSAFRT